ncbi:MAG: YeeE/YedE family protein [Bacteroidetes bacterium]|nr:YeeE/YedE family protein [Bacteroidota bacterium]
MSSFLSQPWPWYVAGPLIGLMVPLLLLIGNKRLGISSSLRHICAACMPGKTDFFKYDWKQEKWNLAFAFGLLCGGVLCALLLNNPNEIIVHEDLKTQMSTNGIQDYQHLVPQDLFNWESLLTIKGFILMVIGGFFVGFGTRYADGCTSGHSIMGISNLEVPSIIATICFMAGGFIMANLILPFILRL